MVIAGLAGHGRERDALLARVVDALERDERVDAAWLSGSIGRGDADQWSDLDLAVVVADGEVGAFWTERLDLYARVGTPVLLQPEMPANAGMPGGNFQLVVFTGPIEIDWSVGPTSRAIRPAASLVLFDRVGIPLAPQPALSAEQRRVTADWWLAFFWAMAPIAVKYAGRGSSRQAASQIDLLTNATIALRRLVSQPDGPAPWDPTANRPLEPELDASLPRLGWTIDPPAALATIRALCADVERLHPALAELGAAIPLAMPGETAALVELAEAVVTVADRAARRPYR